MWVVKLGGSLCRSSTLPQWLDAIERCGRGRCVVVPGGGPFADQIRDVHACWGFDEGTAHLMAVHAMDQYGLMLTGLQPELTPVHNIAEMKAVLNDSKVAVWIPSQMVFGAKKIPRNWDMTSDSLAAWLANSADAERLVLIKSVYPQALSVTATRLAECGVVDPCFEKFIQKGSYAVYMFTRGDYASFERWAGGKRTASTQVLKE